MYARAILTLLQPSSEEGFVQDNPLAAIQTLVGLDVAFISVLHGDFAAILLSDNGADYGALLISEGVPGDEVGYREDYQRM